MGLERLIFFSILLSTADLRETGGPSQCVIIQEKETLAVPFTIPSYLKSNDKSQCQVEIADTEMLRCGLTDVYIKPECVCSFHSVYEPDYHVFSSCPEGAQSDIVIELKYV
uniref:Uncharacterized protein LOC111132253 n=1 Tax=Crassostrea virginica TaxID=6565 RepID=A0A8B8E816_CRAVI|nr:uncharacterized protein LOC111132253 [Crassostrea virginica]